MSYCSRQKMQGRQNVVISVPFSGHYVFGPEILEACESCVLAILKGSVDHVQKVVNTVEFVWSDNNEKKKN